MLFCLVLLHAGFLPAIFVFLMWSLPGAIGMYALSLGVQRINEVLPDPAYALLSGLNASTTAIIALAAVQLSQKAIKNRLLRVLVIFGACAGLCYNALWYFPALMLIGGSTLMIWEVWLRQRVDKWRARTKRRRSDPQTLAEESAVPETVDLQNLGQDATVQLKPEPTSDSGFQRRRAATHPAAPPTAEGSKSDGINTETAKSAGPTNDEQPPEITPSVDHLTHAIPVTAGITIIVSFFISFIVILVIRGTVKVPLAYSLFANMYLAGTIIFGGGPVVIPLLREYVVQPGWVSPRDFLIGLALIQAFPGPNFNFAGKFNTAPAFLLIFSDRS
jgi:chromate transport protein ChrA